MVLSTQTLVHRWQLQFQLPRVRQYPLLSQALLLTYPPPVPTSHRLQVHLQLRLTLLSATEHSGTSLRELPMLPPPWDQLEVADQSGRAGLNLPYALRCIKSFCQVPEKPS